MTAAYPRPRLGWISAVVLGAALAMAAQSCERDPVWATAICDNGYVLSTGVLTSGDYSPNGVEGYFTIGKPLGDSTALTSFYINPGNPSIHHVRPLLTKVVHLCLVPAVPREHQRISR